MPQKKPTQKVLPTFLYLRQLTVHCSDIWQTALVVTKKTAAAAKMSINYQ